MDRTRVYEDRKPDRRHGATGLPEKENTEARDWYCPPWSWQPPRPKPAATSEQTPSTRRAAWPTQRTVRCVAATPGQRIFSESVHRSFFDFTSRGSIRETSTMPSSEDD